MAYHWIVSLFLITSMLLPASRMAQDRAAPAGITPQAALVTGITTMVSSVSITPGGFNAVRVLCPASTVAIGGGIDLDNVLTMKVTSSGPSYPGTNFRLLEQADGSAPAPVGWQASAVNNDTTNKVMKVAVVCAPITGVTSVVDTGTAPASSFTGIRVECPANTVALGGGIDPNNVLTMEVTSTAPVYPPGDRLLFMPDGPVAAPEGWQASALNHEGGAQIFKVGVICAPAGGITSVVGSFTLPAGSFDGIRLSCPPNTQAIGGGIDPNNVFTTTVSSSAPTFAANNERLIFQPNGPNPAPVGFQATQVNRTMSPMIVKVAAICARQFYPNYLPYIQH